MAARCGQRFCSATATFNTGSLYATIGSPCENNRAGGSEESRLVGRGNRRHTTRKAYPYVETLRCNYELAGRNQRLPVRARSAGAGEESAAACDFWELVRRHHYYYCTAFKSPAKFLAMSHESSHAFRARGGRARSGAIWARAATKPDSRSPLSSSLPLSLFALLVGSLRSRRHSLCLAYIPSSARFCSTIRTLAVRLCRPYGHFLCHNRPPAIRELLNTATIFCHTLRNKHF